MKLKDKVKVIDELEFTGCSITPNGLEVDGIVKKYHYVDRKEMVDLDILDNPPKVGIFTLKGEKIVEVKK